MPYGPNIGKDRVFVSYVSSVITGEQREEGRGGDTRSRNYEDKRTAVKNFLQRFKGRESNYSRARTTRIYLSNYLTITKLWRMYEDTAGTALHAKEPYFRKIFNTSFNIGFGKPRTDVCSKCMHLEEKLKSAQRDSKAEIKAELKLHRMKATAFMKVLNVSNPTTDLRL